MSLPPLLHPALIFLVSNSTLTLVAAQTTRGSLVRVASSGLLIGSALIFHPALRHFVDSTGWVARVPAGAIFWALITYLDRLILRGWDYEHYGPRVANSNQSEHASETQDGKDDISYPGTRMDFGSEVSGSARGIGRFWEVKNTPLFSKLQPEFVPSRSVFIFVQAIAAVTCYYVNNYLADVTLSLDPSLLDARHVPLLTRISNVTSAEIRTRIVATLGYWIMQYCMLQFFYSIAGIIGAVTNPKDIRLWRPLFGSLSDGFTIRNLWGKSWHQTLRSGLEGVSDLLTHGVLQLPKQGLLQRYTKIFFSFMISGLMHLSSDMGGQVSMAESGALQFFCMQALGIVLEDGAQAVYRKVTGRTQGSNPTLLERSIGYSWVLFFIVWTTPVWVFPVTLKMRKQDARLDFEAAKPMFSGFVRQVQNQP